MSTFNLAQILYKAFFFVTTKERSRIKLKEWWDSTLKYVHDGTWKHQTEDMWSGERTRKSVLTSKNGVIKQKRDYTPVSSPLQAGIKISFIRLGQAAALFAHLSSHPFLLVSASSSFLSFPYSWERKEGNCLVQDCDPALRTSTHPPSLHGSKKSNTKKKQKKTAVRLLTLQHKFWNLH